MAKERQKRISVQKPFGLSKAERGGMTVKMLTDAKKHFDKKREKVHQASRRLKQVKFVGEQLGTLLQEHLDQQEDELADLLATRFAGSGEMPPEKLKLSKREVKIAIEEATSYVHLAFVPIVKKALWEFAQTNHESGINPEGE